MIFFENVLFCVQTPQTLGKMNDGHKFNWKKLSFNCWNPYVVRVSSERGLIYPEIHPPLKSLGKMNDGHKFNWKKLSFKDWNPYVVRVSSERGLIYPEIHP